MDTLKSKTYKTYDYLCRYDKVPSYYDSLRKREVAGIGSNMLKTAPFVTHYLTQEDTLNSLSLKYYGNPVYWWVIAYFNDIQDAFSDLMENNRTMLKIPNIASIEFGRLN